MVLLQESLVQFVHMQIKIIYLKLAILKWERDDEIGRGVNYIRKNFRKNILISDLVEVSGLNHRKLHRGFIELFGIAPMQFITRTRIESACDDF